MNLSKMLFKANLKKLHGRVEKLKTKDFIYKNKIIAICRNVFDDELTELVSALYEGGVKLVEVTFDQNSTENQQKTVESVKQLTQLYNNKIKVGTGTVITKQQVYDSKEAGAEFILAPNVNKEIIQTANDLDLVTIPGAMTPSEIIEANQASADFVKLFPTGDLGLNYVKSILGPINHVDFIGTAGITPDNLAEYLELGFVGAGISSYLCDKQLIKEKKYDVLTERAKTLMTIALDHTL